MKTLKIESRWVAALSKGRYVVDAPPTGFRSTTKLEKATRFESERELVIFAAKRGLFVFRSILVHFNS